jgi:hypothetical protein
LYGHCQLLRSQTECGCLYSHAVPSRHRGRRRPRPRWRLWSIARDRSNINGTRASQTQGRLQELTSYLTYNNGQMTHLVTGKDFINKANSRSALSLRPPTFEATVSQQRMSNQSGSVEERLGCTLEHFLANRAEHPYRSPKPCWYCEKNRKVCKYKLDKAWGFYEQDCVNCLEEGKYCDGEPPLVWSIRATVPGRNCWNHLTHAISLTPFNTERDKTPQLWRPKCEGCYNGRLRCKAEDRGGLVDYLRSNPHLLPIWDRLEEAYILPKTCDQIEIGEIKDLPQPSEAAWFLHPGFSVMYFGNSGSSHLCEAGSWTSSDHNWSPTGSSSTARTLQFWESDGAGSAAGTEVFTPLSDPLWDGMADGPPQQGIPNSSMLPQIVSGSQPEVLDFRDVLEFTPENSVPDCSWEAYFANLAQSKEGSNR